jgi:hypothetical protein
MKERYSTVEEERAERAVWRRGNRLRTWECSNCQASKDPAQAERSQALALVFGAGVGLAVAA